MRLETIDVLIVLFMGQYTKSCTLLLENLFYIVVTLTERILEVLQYVQLFHVVFQKVGMCAS